MQGSSALVERPSTTSSSVTERLLAGVLAAVDEAVVVVGPDARVIIANPSFERATGRAPGKIPGSPLATMLELPSGAVSVGDLHSGVLRPLDRGPVAVRVRQVQVDLATDRAYTVAAFRVPGEGPGKGGAGQSQPVMLDRIRGQLGPRWSEARPRVIKCAEQMVRTQLGDADRLLEVESGFVVCFAHLDEDASETRAREMEDGIMARLLGGMVPGISEAVAGIMVPALDRVSNGPECRSVGTLEVRSVADRVEAEARLRHLLARAAHTTTLEFDASYNVSGRHADYTFARQRDGLGGELDRFVWSGADPVALDIVADYALIGVGVALAALATGQAPPGMLVLSVPTDALLLRRMVERLSKLLQSIPKSLSNRLALELRGLRPDMSAEAVCELVPLLAGLCRGAVVHLPDPGMHDLVHTELAHLVLLTLQAEALSSPQMPRLVQMSGAAGVPLLIQQVDSEDSLMLLYEARIALMTGSALGGGDPAK